MNEVKNTSDRQASERKRAGEARSLVSVSVANTIIRRSAKPTSNPPERTPPVRGGVSEGTRARGPASQPRTHVGARTAEAASDQRPNLDIDEVLDHAMKLDRKQAKQLLDQLALRMQMTDKSLHNRDLEAWVSCVHNELNRELGAENSYGIMQVRKALGEPECWRPVEAFMAAAGMESRTSAERRAMYMLLAELLIEHTRYETRRMKFGLVLSSVARYVVDLVAIFDDAFPGYLRSGLAFMVADQQQKIATGATAV